MPINASRLTICGLAELDLHRARGVTHVLSIMDPDWPDPVSFGTYEPHHRTILRFHDAIESGDGTVLPERLHVEHVVAFGQRIVTDLTPRGAGHVLVHCHAGVSRSTAAMTTLLAMADPAAGEDKLFERLVAIRPQAWPNLRMIEFADGMLGREGRLVAAVGRLYARQLARQPLLGAERHSQARSREVALGLRSATT